MFVGKMICLPSNCFNEKCESFSLIAGETRMMYSELMVIKPRSNARCIFGDNEIPLVIVSSFEIAKGTM